LYVLLLKVQGLQAVFNSCPGVLCSPVLVHHLGDVGMLQACRCWASTSLSLLQHGSRNY
jgi:hypothetical protein